MILVSNCPHGNGVYTLIDADANAIVKSSYAAEGMASLAREYAGYAWYFGLPGVTAARRCELIAPSDHYRRLIVERFSGRPGDPYRPFHVNAGDALAAVEMYAAIWPGEGGRCALHGDFSLGNMLFGGAGSRPRLVDWEHFHPDAAPWGFDLVNLVYECAFFSAPRGGPFSAADREAFTAVRGRVDALVRARRGMACTLDALTRFIDGHAAYWGALLKKLPVMKFSDDQNRALRALEQDVPQP